VTDEARAAGLGTPRLHLRSTDSTNARARELASAGAPHGTLVTASSQSAGRGRQGRTWSAPAGSSLLMSLVLRDWPGLLPLAAAVAIAEVAGEQARIKWPNDVHVDGLKIAGILVEARPQDRWAVVGIGVNVAVSVADLPPELHATAGTLGLPPSSVEPFLASLLVALSARLAAAPEEVLAAFRARDALLGRPITWNGGAGQANGIDEEGRLLVVTAEGSVVLNAGEVHLGTVA
jgi:BirA family transcriptional regulator, biotin operon repressor / biotin---[acetyl-CoA-carboxylase] ligase